MQQQAQNCNQTLPPTVDTDEEGELGFDELRNALVVSFSMQWMRKEVLWKRPARALLKRANLCDVPCDSDSEVGENEVEEEQFTDDELDF